MKRWIPAFAGMTERTPTKGAYADESVCADEKSTSKKSVYVEEHVHLDENNLCRREPPLSRREPFMPQEPPS